MTVIKMENYKNSKQDAFKIDGESFEKIKTARKRFDSLMKKAEKKMEELNDQLNEENNKLWAAIAKETGLKREGGYTLDTSFESLDFYVIKRMDADDIAQILSECESD